MRDELIIQEGQWAVYFATHCGEYSCSNCSECIEIRRTPGGVVVWHEHTKRFFRRPRRVEDLLEQALQFIAGQRAKDIAELERVAEIKEMATARMRMERELESSV